MRIPEFFFVTIAWLMLASAAPAVVLVDTGANPGGTSWTFSYEQSFAGEFSIGSKYTLDSIEGFFGNEGGLAGNVTISLHSDAGNIPGPVLFSASTTLAANAAADWNGVYGLGWNLGVGTYWVSFITDQNIAGNMPGNAPNPLDEYAQFTNRSWLDEGPNYFDYLEVGIRINATPDIPEPASLVLLASGLAGLGFAHRKPAKQQKP